MKPRLLLLLGLAVGYAMALIAAMSSSFTSCCLGAQNPAASTPIIEAQLAEPISPAGPGCVEVRFHDGTTILLVVDTGSPNSYFEKSLEPRLGKCLGTESFGWSFFTNQLARTYRTPELYIGGTLLVMPKSIWVVDSLPNLPNFPSAARVVGVLGMDCLTNYCLQ